MQRRFLILSDGKPGHLNQSIAFAKHLGCEYDIQAVRFRNRLAKAFSYLADRVKLQIPSFFCLEAIAGEYAAVVSAGSETYYANRVLAKQLGAKSVAIMLPKGYRYDFDLIVAQQHDEPPAQENILTLPINLTYVQPQGLVTPKSGRKYVAVIVGGDSKQGRLEPERLRSQLQKVFTLFPSYEFWLTTSRRTSPEVEEMLRGFEWSRAVYYSKEPINPIADFLQHSEYVFITADSSSMISEAVSFGCSCVEILTSSNENLAQGKFSKMFTKLATYPALHLFDGKLGEASKKIDLATELRGRGF